MVSSSPPPPAAPAAEGGLTAGGWRAVAPAVLLAAWGGNHFSPLLLMYRAVDGYSAVEVNLFFAFYILGLAPGFLVAGPFSDEHGRKRLVVLALGLGVLGSVVLGLGGAQAGLMCAGRFVSGLSVAVAMVVGTSWIKELSSHDAEPATRARRASLTLTAGFGVGAGVSGALAQWGPAPTLLPYGVQIALSLAAAVPLLRARETRTGGSAGPARSLRADLRVPPAHRRRFRRVVLPMAPWVFAAPAMAFVVGPALVAGQVGPYRVAFAALAAVVTLAFGAGVQPFVPALARRTGGRPGAVGLGLVALATAVLAVDASVRSPGLALVCAAGFGLGYGICIVAGLVEVQAMADPHSLAGLTGVYYALTYGGFVLPVLLAGLAYAVPYPGLLAAVALLALACTALVGVAAGRPREPEPATA
ncbi:MAG: putative arabinose efflux permease, family [Friedmanniella sp.]|nr:putative arabinose efflux permease, family [Friedmanniella sp.]